MKQGKELSEEKLLNKKSSEVSKVTFLIYNKPCSNAGLFLF